MKKVFSLIACFATVMACLSLSSCSNDDDEDGGGSTNSDIDSEIIGSWAYDDDDVDFTIFMKDGTMYFYGKADGEEPEYAESATYTYKNNILTYVFPDGETEREKVVIEGNTLTEYYVNSSRVIDVLHKVKQPVSTSKLKKLAAESAAEEYDD